MKEIFRSTMEDFIEELEYNGVFNSAQVSERFKLVLEAILEESTKDGKLNKEMAVRYMFYAGMFNGLFIGENGDIYEYVEEEEA